MQSHRKVLKKCWFYSFLAISAGTIVTLINQLEVTLVNLKKKFLKNVQNDPKINKNLTNDKKQINRD